MSPVPGRWSCEQQCECEWRSRLLEHEQRFFELEYEQRLSAHIWSQNNCPLDNIIGKLCALRDGETTSEGHEPRQPFINYSKVERFGMDYKKAEK